MTTVSPCFACLSAFQGHEPQKCVRTLCSEHMRRTVTLSGASLPDVISSIESEMSDGSLEGAPLQWLFGPIRVRCDDMAIRTGWCFYVPVIFLAAEDRFGASSWFDFWISDLSLDAVDLRRPTLDTLARSLPTAIPATSTKLAGWTLDVAGPEGLKELDYAWAIWTTEARVAQRRGTTGRIWPHADELTDWLFDPRRLGQADSAEEEAFAVDFVRSLRKRVQRRRAI